MSVRAATSKILIGLINRLLTSDNQPIAEHQALSMQYWQSGEWRWIGGDGDVSSAVVVGVLVTFWVERAKLANDFLACDCMGCGTSFGRPREP